MLQARFQVRADTSVEQIDALAGDELWQSIGLSPGLPARQIEAIDHLLATRPTLTVAISKAEALSQLGKLRNVKWLQLFFSVADDPIEDAKLQAALCFPALRGLRLHAHWVHDLALLRNLPQDLESLVLDAETDRPKVGMDALRRFRDLRRLSLAGPCKGLDALGDLRNLRELGLPKVGADTCAFLSNLKELEHLYLGRGSLSDLTVVGTLPRLRLLSLFELRRLSDVSPLSDCHTLQWLDLDTLPGVSGLPSLAESLLVLKLESLPSLVDFARVSSASALELFLFVSSKKPAAVPADFEPVLRLPSLRHVKAAFGITRLNEEFDRLASQYGKGWNAPDFDAYRARVALSATRETAHRPDLPA